jgi:uncharacterized membrane protein YheB (UPF0754 family)
MPKQRCYTVYALDELTGAARRKAIENLGRQLSDNYPAEFVTESFRQFIQQDYAGYPTDQIYWSLGYCQGDGVAFYGNCDVKRLAIRMLTEEARKEFSEAIENVTIKIDRLGTHYNHWNTMIVEIEDYYVTDLTDRVQKFLNDWQDQLNAEVKEVSRKLEKMGYAEFDYQRSEEVVLEYARENEVDFDENGNIK